MSDPFQDAHGAARRKAEAEQAAQEIVKRDARIAATAQRRQQAAKPPPAYPWPKKIWEPQ